MSAAALCSTPLRRLQIDPDEYETLLGSLSFFLARRYPASHFSSSNTSTTRSIAHQWLHTTGAGRKFWGGSHQYLILYGNDDDENDEDEEKPPSKFLEWPENKGEIREGVTRILILLRQNPAALQQQVTRDEDDDEDDDDDEDEDDDEDHGEEKEEEEEEEEGEEEEGEEEEGEEERPHKGKSAANLVIRPKTKPQQKSVCLAFRPAKRMKRS